ncbi:MAG: AsnC family protein [Candidatus Nanohaloarchaea archaeon]|nr:AsnC family protein [Candidatus Nanohaloarchaea archaeon]
MMEKIVRVLLENPAIPYNTSQLAEAAGVSRNALYRRCALPRPCPADALLKPLTAP